ncbi:MAG: DUF2059 domain-containing protein [Xanthomonadaceae bacterium]|nr:DUF2059 domain-containing protein [Xanthomonadaceae bacterium]MDE1965249.1 DUF2059 domain-containing protein [Xanthomonadaceae bacterium]
MAYRSVRLGCAGVLAAMSLALMASPASAAQASASQIRELMGMFGTQRMFQQMNAQMAEMMVKQLPCVPPGFWNGFLDDSSTRELTDKLVPIYQRHFTEQDVRGLLKFYRSPLGRKLLLEQPSVMTEVMQVGRKWGEQRARSMIAGLQGDGTLTRQGRCPAPGQPSPPLGQPASASSSR